MASAELLKSGLVKQFYDEHKPWLQSWLAKKTGSSFDAADLTHDTFIKLLMKGDGLHIIEPRAYLTRIAHGLMVNFLQRRDIERAYLEAMVSLGYGQELRSPSPEEYLMTLEKLITIDRLLSGLPIKVRQAFLMHKLQGLSYSEIAADMQMSVISIKKYIARAVLHCAQM